MWEITAQWFTNYSFYGIVTFSVDCVLSVLWRRSGWVVIYRANSAFVYTSRPHFTLFQWSFLSFSFPACLTELISIVGGVNILVSFAWSHVLFLIVVWKEKLDVIQEEHRAHLERLQQKLTEAENKYSKLQQEKQQQSQQAIVRSRSPPDLALQRATEERRPGEVSGHSYLLFVIVPDRHGVFHFFSSLGHGSKWISWNRLRADGELISQEIAFVPYIEPGIARWRESRSKNNRCEWDIGLRHWSSTAGIF